MEYRISVIMGIYNCAPTLAEALDSLIAQTYQNFKVIMCDDGSKDSTVDVAQSYVERYPQKFILIRNERNMKLAASLNNCLQYADTEYVARMDGDDTCAPERFEILINFLDSHPEYSHVSTSMKLFDEDGFYGQTKPMPEIPDKSQFKTGTPYCHAPTMFRRSTLSAVGNYTAEARVERIEDYYFLISVSVLLETAVLIYFILSTGTPRIYEKTFLYFVTVSTAWSTGILRSFSTNISGDCPSVAPASDQTKSANESFS